MVSTIHYVTRRPKPDRELIVRTTTKLASTPVVSMMTCLKCGTFKKSGKVSCCAPGGSWFQNCGGSGNGNAGHTWSEGVKACTLTAKTISSVCATCVTIRKSGKMSCCGRGGSWFGTCGGADNTQIEHTWYEGIRTCKARRQSKAAMGQQLRTAQQQKLNESSNDTRVPINSISVIVATNMFAFTPTNTSTPTSVKMTMRPPARPTSITESDRAPVRNALADTVATTASSPASSGTPITGREHKQSLNIVDYIGVLAITVLWY